MLDQQQIVWHRRAGGPGREPRGELTVETVSHGANLIVDAGVDCGGRRVGQWLSGPERG
jgi:hypothetical protein